MDRIEKDADREARIHGKAIVDAYVPEEQAISWYYYLDDRLVFPFTARCVVERSISPLQEGEEVKVTGMSDTEACRCEMFVEVEWMGRTLAVPLAQLEAPEGDEEFEESDEAIRDWRYWVGRGYQLC